MTKADYATTSPPHPWGGRPLHPSEIEAEQAICEAALRDIPKWQPLRWTTYRLSNRAYMRALKKGETIESAEISAGTSAGFIQGIAFGAILTLMAVGTFFYFVGIYRGGGIIQFVVIVFFWIVGFVWAFDKARKAIVKKAKPVIQRIRAKFKRKEKAA